MQCLSSNSDGTEVTVEIMNTPRREPQSSATVEAHVWTTRGSGWKTTTQAGRAGKCLLFD